MRRVPFEILISLFHITDGLLCTAGGKGKGSLNLNNQGGRKGRVRKVKFSTWVSGGEESNASSLNPGYFPSRKTEGKREKKRKKRGSILGGDYT